MILFLLAALGLATPVFVQASVLNLRAEPDAASRIEGWVRIGTAVEVTQESGDWVAVRLVNRPTDHAVTGWVLGRFLDVHRPTVESVRRLADADERADRLAALRGEADSAANQTHLAMCEGRRVEYIGFFDADGAFVDRASWDASAQERMDLSALHWTWVEPSGERGVIQGSPFVRPFLTERWNERDGSAFAPGTCETICEEPTHLILGPCDRSGTVFVSRPVEGVAPDPLQAGSRRSLEQSTVGALMDDPSRRGDYTEGIVHRASKDPYEWSQQTWVIQDWRRQYHLLLGEQEGAVELQAPMRTFLRVPGVGLLGVAPVRMQTVRGWVLANVRGHGLRSWTVHAEGWGC